jgi:hypothetical protein
MQGMSNDENGLGCEVASICFLNRKNIITSKED